ncbi:MAG: cupin domain-containing protein [Myxococcota bacterium]|nr:cupin domain-containing protein [Myxococcota bacterium]MDW8361660.1 cupin domain-containing protein [Myxococcales bacterium]
MGFRHATGRAWMLQPRRRARGAGTRSAARLVALLSVGCGAASAARPHTAGGETAASRPTTAGATLRLLEPHGPRGTALAGLYARIRIEPGGSVVLPANDCQELFAIVESGRARVRLAGVAEPVDVEGGWVLYAGAPPGLSLGNPFEQTVELLLAVARHRSAPFDPSTSLEDALYAPPSGCTHPQGHRAQDPPPGWAGRIDDVEALSVAAGALSVRIVVDGPTRGARLGALSRLEGRADLRVPEHLHEASAELLWIEAGEGSMRVGDAELEVRPVRFVHVPAGVLHDFRGAGREPLRAWQLYVPGGPEQRFRAAPPR